MIISNASGLKNRKLPITINSVANVMLQSMQTYSTFSLNLPSNKKIVAANKYTANITVNKVLIAPMLMYVAVNDFPITSI